MKKIGRNDLCPCGSGKKFKRCHMGREDELALDNLGEFSDEMSSRITDLPEAHYGRSREMMEALDIEELTGNTMGIPWEFDLWISRHTSTLTCSWGHNQRPLRAEAVGSLSIFIKPRRPIRTMFILPYRMILMTLP